MEILPFSAGLTLMLFNSIVPELSYFFFFACLEGLISGQLNCECECVCVCVCVCVQWGKAIELTVEEPSAALVRSASVVLN